MAQAPSIDLPRTRPAPRRIPKRGVFTFEQFLALEEPERAEWVDGRLVEMAGITGEHDRVQLFLARLVEEFLERFALGETRHDPFLMRAVADGPGRAPDMMFVLNANLHRFRDNYLNGPADIAVEVVSPGSRRVDRGEKFYEYEAAGITEYWLIDPDRRTAEFFVLDQNARYGLAPTPDGVFRSTVLEGFWLKVEWLWERPPLSEAAAALGLR